MTILVRGVRCDVMRFQDQKKGYSDYVEIVFTDHNNEQHVAELWSPQEVAFFMQSLLSVTKRLWPE